MDPILGITILLAAALVGGIVAIRLKQPVVLGYIIVGVVAGPHVLGVYNDQVFIESAANIGVALLMFTLGLELSFDQLRIGRIGIWGSICQIVFTALLGVAAAYFLLKWSLPQSVLFGLVIYSSSTAICLKVLTDRGEMDSVHGRIIIAVAIFQDIAAIFMILILPFLGEPNANMVPSILIAFGKVLGFIIGALVIGAWVLPWLIGTVGGLKNHELFLLTVLVIAMGTSAGTYLMGLPSVFGAFLIGFVLRRLRFNNQAKIEIAPFKDVFVAIFFVSLGMLLDVQYVASHWRSFLLMVPLIVLIKFIVIFAVTWFFGYGRRVAVLTGVSLYHIGEFGFIIAQSGLSSGIISSDIYSLLIASSVITMLIMPSTVGLASWLYQKFDKYPSKVDHIRSISIGPTETLTNPVIIAGYGRIGQNIVKGLQFAKIPFTVVELDPEHIPELRDKGIDHIYGDCCHADVLSQAGLATADTIVITFPDQEAVENTARNALSLNPKIKIVARVHQAREARVLRKMGVNDLISPEYEASVEFLKRALQLYGLKDNEVDKAVTLTFKSIKVPETSSTVKKPETKPGEAAPAS